MHRDFVNQDGDHGTVYYRIDEGEEWFLCFEVCYPGDGISRNETVWNQSDEVYIETRWENERPVYEKRMTAERDIITNTTWEYYKSIGAVKTEHRWSDDGTTAYEKIYTNPGDNSTYEERTYVDESGDYQRVFTVNGVTRESDQAILTLPAGLKVIESETFANVSGCIVMLHSGVAAIADDAFAADAVLLVPNEEVAKLAQDAGYVWFFEQ